MPVCVCVCVKFLPVMMFIWCVLKDPRQCVHEYSTSGRDGMSDFLPSGGLIQTLNPAAGIKIKVNRNREKIAAGSLLLRWEKCGWSVFPISFFAAFFNMQRQETVVDCCVKND